MVANSEMKCKSKTVLEVNRGLVLDPLQVTLAQGYIHYARYVMQHLMSTKC